MLSLVSALLIRSPAIIAVAKAVAAIVRVTKALMTHFITKDVRLVNL